MSSSKKIYSIVFLILAILIPLIFSGIVFDVYEGAGPASSAGNVNLTDTCKAPGAVGACAAIAASANKADISTQLQDISAINNVFAALSNIDASTSYLASIKTIADSISSNSTLFTQKDKKTNKSAQDQVNSIIASLTSVIASAKASYIKIYSNPAAVAKWDGNSKTVPSNPEVLTYQKYITSQIASIKSAIQTLTTTIQTLKQADTSKNGTKNNTIMQSISDKLNTTIATPTACPTLSTSCPQLPATCPINIPATCNPIILSAIDDITKPTKVTTINYATGVTDIFNLYAYEIVVDKATQTLSGSSAGRDALKLIVSAK